MESESFAGNSASNMSSQNVIETALPECITSVVPGRKKSEVWNFFEKTETKVNDTVLLKAKCVVCGEFLSRGGNHGTKHLLRHIERHHKSVTQNLDIRKQMQLGLNASGNLSNFKFDKNAARQELVKYIIKAELPFTFIEKMTFVG
ncbi:unnamed protein product [Rhodiola kirilowii]